MQKVYRLIIIGVMMSVLGSLGLSAQIKGYNIVVSVTPDHQDWNYKVGEKANFTVNVRKSGTLLTNVKVDYEAGPAMFPDVKKSTTLKDGMMNGATQQNTMTPPPYKTFIELKKARLFKRNLALYVTSFVRKLLLNRGLEVHLTMD